MYNTISTYSNAVRESTLKRLQSIPAGLENWKISMNAMSIADIAKHLVDADMWLFKKLGNNRLEPITGETGTKIICDRREYNAIIEKLRVTGKTRYEKILGIDDMSRLIFDSRFNGEVSAFWIILRGNLDHETHHRGQISSYIRVLKDTGMMI